MKKVIVGFYVISFCTIFAAPIHDAANQELLDDVKNLIQDDPNNVNLPDENGDTPLHWSVNNGPVPKNGTNAVAQFLLTKGANVNAKNNKGRTPLHTAVETLNEKAVPFLLDHKAAVDAQDKNGYTPLYLATMFDHWMRKMRAADIAKVLVARGSDVTVKAFDLSTPLHRAAAYGDISIAKLLIDHKAAVNAQDNQGNTPLHKVLNRDFNSEEGSLSVFNLLLDHKAVITRANNNGDTPLHLAAAYADRLEVVSKLIERGALVNAKNKNGDTPLHKAAKRSGYFIFSESIQLLVDHHAEVNAKNNDGDIPLHYAAQHGSGSQGIVILLEHGSDVDVKNNQGDTPLHNAAYKGSSRSVGLLIEAGSEIDEQDNAGDTPLHKALAGEREEIYLDMDEFAIVPKLLLAKGAANFIENQEGKSPVDLAMERDEKEGVAEGRRWSSVLSKGNAWAEDPLVMQIFDEASKILATIKAKQADKLALLIAALNNLKARLLNLREKMQQFV